MNSPEPSHEDIAHRAYSTWEKEGRPEGRADEFWFTAEKELRTKPAQTTDDGGDTNDVLHLHDGPDITNLDTALPPDQRRKARGQRRSETEPPAARKASPQTPPHYFVLLDRAHLRIYLASEAGSQPSLASSLDQPAGKQSYVAGDSDRAGRFPSSGVGASAGVAPSGGSIDERLPMQEEHERRLSGDLADHLNAFLTEHPTATWDFAAGPSLHRAVLERLSAPVRSRLGQALQKDLVNQPATGLRGHFASQPSRDKSQEPRPR